MNSDYLNQVLRVMSMEARANGIDHPVLLRLSWTSSPAQDIHEVLTGDLISAPDREDDPDAEQAFLVCHLAAGKLLREFAGAGGDLVSRKIADAPHVGIWSVALRAHRISYCAYHEGAIIMHGKVPCDDGGRPMQIVGDEVTGTGPTMPTPNREDGEPTRECSGSRPVATYDGAPGVPIAPQKSNAPTVGTTVETEATEELRAIMFHSCKAQLAAMEEAVSALTKQCRNIDALVQLIVDGRPERAS